MKAAPSPRQSGNRLVYFNALPEESRLRLAACLRGEANPAPLLRRRGGRPELWALLLLVASAAGTAAAVVDFSGVLLSTEMGAALCAAAALAVAAIIGLVRAVAVRQAVPFPEGTYVFATDVIEAKGDCLRLWSLHALQKLATTHQHCNGFYTHSIVDFIFPGKTISFRLGQRKDAERFAGELQRARLALLQAEARGDYDTVARHDPLMKARVFDDWESFGVKPRRLKKRQLKDKTLARPVPWPCGTKAQVFLVGGIAGLIAGPLTVMAINTVRDDAMFVKTSGIRTIAACQHYLSHGKAYSGEVRLLLATITYEQARNSRSVSRLRAFVSEFPRSEHVPAARQFIHELYQGALKALTKNVKPACAEFLGRLFIWLEQRESPSLVVRFRTPDSADLPSPSGFHTLPGANIAPLGESFTGEACRRREGSIVSALSHGFRKLVPGEILDLKPGPPLTGESVKEAAKPGLDISYSVSASGEYYVPEKGGQALLDRDSIAKTRAYTGISVSFQITLRIPGDANPFQFGLEVVPPPRFTVMDSGRWGFLTGPADGVVYDQMASEAFKKLEERLLAELIAAPETPGGTMQGIAFPPPDTNSQKSGIGK